MVVRTGPVSTVKYTRLGDAPAGAREINGKTTNRNGTRKRHKHGVGGDGWKSASENH